MKIGYIILAVLVWIAIQIEIDRQNPCSQFSDNPSECNSDRQKDILE